MEIKYFEPDLAREKRNIELNGSFGGISFKSILECNGFSTVEFSRILSKLKNHFVPKPMQSSCTRMYLSLELWRISFQQDFSRFLWRRIDDRAFKKFEYKFRYGISKYSRKYCSRELIFIFFATGYDNLALIITNN